MRLRTKLGLVLFPLVVGPLLAVGWMAYGQLRDGARQDTDSGMRGALEEMEREVAKLVRNARANIELLATSGLVVRYARTDDELERFQILQPALLRQFRNIQKVYPEYYEIRFLTPDGFEDARAETEGLGNRTEEEGGEEWFRRLSGSDARLPLEIRTNPDTGDAALYVYRRLEIAPHFELQRNGVLEHRGFLAITVSPAAVLGRMNANHLIREGGLVLADVGGGRIHAAGRSPFRGAIPGDLLRALREWDGAGPLAFLHEGAPFLARARFFEPGLAAVVVLPGEALERPLRFLAYVVGGTTLVTVVLASLLLAFGLRRLVLSPLRELTRATAAIGDGDFTPGIAVSSRDELGDLAVSVRRMGTRLARSSEQVRFLAFHDQLTGLPNRRLFRERVEEALLRQRRGGGRLALLFLDIDNFKQINDTLGHQVGDALLVSFSQRLARSLREEDVLSRALFSRLGGDEFLILLEEIHSPFDVAAVASRILEHTRRPFELNGGEHIVTTSIGLTLFPDDGAEVDGLIRNADLAMYHAKSEGRNNYQFFSTAMNTAASERLAVETRLRRALERGELRLVYQPQVEIASGRVMAVEALLRWQNPELGLLAPDRFIAVAEETGLIRDIGAWVLRQACRQRRLWQDAGLPEVAVSVNLSSVQVRRDDVAAQVRAALAESHLPVEALHLELTESVLMEALDSGSARLQELSRMGVRIALDDFGTGYSSLSYLHRFPVDSLKIDRSFVAGLAADRDKGAIVDAVIALGRSLGLVVVAEGVETERQLMDLRRRGCHWAQGYYVSLPLTADQTAELLAAQAAAPTRAVALPRPR